MRMLWLAVLIAVTGCGAVSPGSPAPATSFSFTISDKQVIESDGMYNSTPSVAKAASGDWVLTYLKGTGHTSSSVVELRRSQDLGSTWSPEVQYFDTTTPDPSLVSTPAGALFLTLVKLDATGASGAAYTRSEDNGLTWSSFTFLSDPASLVYAFGPSLVQAGTTMFGVGYVTQSNGTSNAMIFDSSDDGHKWTQLSSIRQTGDAGINETSIAKVGPTQLLAISRDDANTSTWAHLSNDSGLTWGSQIDYTAQLGILQAPGLIQAGSVLLLFGRQYDPATYPHQFVVFASHDGGTTFTDRTVLDTYTGNSIDGGYCWPLLRDDGKVFVVYYADSNNLSKPDIKSLVLEL